MNRNDFEDQLMAKVLHEGSAWFDKDVRRRIFAELYGEPLELKCAHISLSDPEVVPFMWATLYGLPGAKTPKGILRWCKENE